MRPQRFANLLIGLAAVACVSLLTLSDAAWRIDAWYYDTLLAHADERADDGIVIVAVDDKSLSALGRWPWSRRTHAHLLDQLRPMQPRGIAFDVLFPEEDNADRDGDEVLAKAMRQARVVLPMAVEPSEPNGPPIEILPLPTLLAAAAGVGHSEVDTDPDGVARRAYLRAGLGDAHWPALALALQRLDPRQRARPVPGLRNPDAAQASPYLWNRDREVLIPFVSDEASFQQVSYIDVIRGSVPPALLRGRWLLVGVTADGVGDAIQTPLSVHEGRLSGVEYQAELLNMLIRGRAIVPLTWRQQLPLAIALVLLPILLMRWSQVRRRSWWLLPTIAAAVALLSAILLFAARHWFPPFAVLATLSLEFALLAVYRWRQSQRLAHSDGLTQLANRRMFDLMLSRELDAALRSARPLSLLLIDVDHFKHYNDTCGHQAGDETLRAVARAIANHARRPRDMAARYGGDEMSMLLPETSAYAAGIVADAIVAEVRALAIPHPDSGVAPIVTVSIGIASTQLRRDQRDVDSLLERADAALYRAKQLGRNQSYCAQAWDA
jgi:diguanylate cyclase (GGDEF)-like protein